MSQQGDTRTLMLAVDGGGSQTRCTAYTLDGTPMATAQGGPSNHLSANKLRVAESLQTALGRTLEQCNAQAKDVLLVSAGFAGVDFDGSGASEMSALLAEAGYPRTLIHGDMVTAHAGALNGKPGVIAIAGTGSVFFGTSPSGECGKLGGYGYSFGDEGGGYWIAVEALRAASKAYDRRGEGTRLVKSICDTLGVSSFSQVPRLLYSGSVYPAQIAELSLTVEATAAQDDRVAIRILEQAGHELAIGATALVQRLHYPAECAVSYYGAILQRCPLVLQTFRRELERDIPSAEVKAPIFGALHGAYLLGKRAIESQERMSRLS